MAKQGIEARLATPEGLERFQRRTAAAGLQNGLAVKTAGFHAGRAVGYGCFFKGCLGIGVQHFG